MTWQEIIGVVKERARAIAPGLIEALNIMCIREIGVECVRAFFEKPDRFRDILLETYGGSIDSVLYIVFSLFIRPSFKSSDDEAWDLARLFISNPRRFMEIVKKVLESENKVEDPVMCIK